MSKVRNFFKFFISRAFLINGTLAAAVIVVVTLLIFSSLNSYVEKEAIVTVPDFSGYYAHELPKLMEEKQLRAEIEYSFNPEREYGMVMEQDPPPGTSVKVNRRIYLIVNDTVPPLYQVPEKCFQSTRRLAEASLNGVGFVVKVSYIPYPDLDRVVYLKYNGKTLAPGDKLPYGAIIHMEVGQGKSSERVGIPDLRGLTREAANNILANASLSLGMIYSCEGCATAQDSAAAVIVGQNPAYVATGQILVGSEIGIYLKVGGDDAPPQDDPSSDQ